MPEITAPHAPQDSATTVASSEHGEESSVAFEQAIGITSEQPPRTVESTPARNPLMDLPPEMRNHVRSFLPLDDRRALAFTSRQHLQEGVQSGDHLRKPVTPLRLLSGEALKNRLLPSGD